MSIGIFDSGVGGLSVLRVLQTQFPEQMFIYVADQAYMPYGTRPTAEIQARSEQISRFLLDEQGCELIVIACNTATAAAVQLLRERFPQTQFVGMEPAIKPAVTQTETGVVGVLATANTLKSQRYASLLERFASEIMLIQDPCLGLVELIERGDFDSPEIEALLTTAVAPMQARGADVIILGCTHYPFIERPLRRIVGEGVSLIDPAEAIGRQVGRLLEVRGGDGRLGEVRFYTTGNGRRFAEQIERLLGLGSAERVNVLTVEI